MLATCVRDTKEFDHLISSHERHFGLNLQKSFVLTKFELPAKQFSRNALKKLFYGRQGSAAKENKELLSYFCV